MVPGLVDSLRSLWTSSARMTGLSNVNATMQTLQTMTDLVDELRIEHPVYFVGEYLDNNVGEVPTR